MRLGIGLGLSGQRGASGPSLNLSATSILESAVSGSTVGVLSVVNHPSGSSGWTFAETADPDNKFTVSGSNLNTSAALNYEAATSHSVTITASKSGQTDIVRVFTITVTNVLEVTLNAITGTFTLAENASAGAVAGAYSGKTSGSTLTLSDDAGGRVAISGGNVVRGATALDYETATSHSFTFYETHPDAAPRSTTVSLTVTDIDEVAPTLSSPTDAANGATGATISVSTNEGNGTLYWYISTSATPPSASVLKAGTGAAAAGSQSVSGTGTQNASPTGLTALTAYYTYFLHRDAAGNDSTIAAADGFTTDEASATPTLEIVFVAIEVDSTEVGVFAREAGDTNPANAYNWRSRSPAGISTSLPYDQAIAPDGTSYLAFSEGYVKQNIANTGLPTYVVPHGYNGSSIAAAGAAWGVGNSLHEASITRANAAVAAILAANPGAVPRFTILVSGGTNDAGASASATTWETNITAALADFRSRVFKNGVSGETIGTDAPTIFRGMMANFIGANNAYANPIEYKMRKFMYSLPNARYWHQPEGQSEGPSNVHPNNAGQRGDGIGAANIRDTTVAPVITFPSSYSLYVGQKFRQEIVTDKDCWLYLTGTDAAQFEIVPITEGNGDTNVNNSRTHWHLQLVGDAALASASTYNITINAKGNAPTTTTQAFQLIGVAAYGSQAETVAAQLAFTQRTDYSSSYKIANATLKRGINMLWFEKLSGSGTALSSIRTSSGLEGTLVTSNSSQWLYCLYSAQDQTCDIILTGANGPFTDANVAIVNAVGTVATPGSSALLPYIAPGTTFQTSSLTLSGAGVILGAGNSGAGATAISGVTLFTQSGTGIITGYRTTTGAFGYNIPSSNYGSAAAIALAKA